MQEMCLGKSFATRRNRLKRPVQESYNGLVDYIDLEPYRYVV